MRKFKIYNRGLKRWCPNGLLKTDGEVASSHPEHYQICWGIEKKDKAGEEIYADSSIVKITINDEDGEHSHKGFFSYNDDILCYGFKEPISNNTQRRIWRMEKLQMYAVSFKIIDTLQENKLGLYDAE